MTILTPGLDNDKPVSTTVAESIFETRQYQISAQEAVEESWDYRDGVPIVLSPTASGKTVMIAGLASAAIYRGCGCVLILTNKQELVEQDAAAIKAELGQKYVGILSTGLKEWDASKNVCVASIQTAAHRIPDLIGAGITHALVDECHDISFEKKSQYRKVIRELRKAEPDLRIAGFSATPYRCAEGPLCQPEHKHNLFTEICYEIGLEELLDGGYISPLIPASPPEALKDFRDWRRTCAGDFESGEARRRMQATTKKACRRVKDLLDAGERKSCLFFGCSIDHCLDIQRYCKDLGLECGVVTNKTDKGRRRELLRRFKSGDLKAIVNVDCLTKGFDSGVDLLAVLRPTKSVVLYTQILGRGMRKAKGKDDCLCLDYGGNAGRFGPLNRIDWTSSRYTFRSLKLLGENERRQAHLRKCNNCDAELLRDCCRCPLCGADLEPPKTKVVALAEQPSTKPFVKRGTKAERKRRREDAKRKQDECRERLKRASKKTKPAKPKAEPKPIRYSTLHYDVGGKTYWPVQEYGFEIVQVGLHERIRLTVVVRLRDGQLRVDQHVTKSQKELHQWFENLGGVGKKPRTAAGFLAKKLSRITHVTLETGPKLLPHTVVL